MAPPEPVAEPNERVDEPWKPPQRSGKLGVDYDELGAEMAPNARVWKKYVEETDRMDKELVEGWNGSLDIILIFAALFSAISTAFVIESSKDLKPDYSQTSAQTLQLMSQTLSTIARGSPLNDSDATVTETQEFTPSSSAIAVNTLWFLSLGLSVAVSLIAILAKEWCHSFMAGRVGSTLRQARLRQQRWDGIQRWKMKEILYTLLVIDVIGTSIVLFAVGLSLYLWDIDIRVALPVLITTSLAALFYIVTVSLPLFFRFCPYTTALARFLYPYWLALLGNQHTMDPIGALVASLGWMSHYWVRMKHIASCRVRSTTQDPHRDNDIEATGDSERNTLPFAFRDEMQEVHYSIQAWVDSMRAMFSTDRSQLLEKYTPMDKVTSSMIVWMTANCEDSSSVDMALQALAGAGQYLPRLPLWECGAIDLLCQRIGDCSISLGSRPSGDSNLARDTLLDDASLYSRSFCFLVAVIEGEGLDMRDMSKPCFVVKDNPESIARLQYTATSAQSYLHSRLDEILNYAWEPPTPRYDLVAYEFNAVPVDASMDVWTRMEDYREQCQKQQQLVQYVASGKVSNLPSGAAVALVNGVTKTYLYNPSQSPGLLIGLLRLLEPSNNLFSDCGRALAVGLAVAALATGNYPGDNSKGDKLRANEPHLKLARDAYINLTETIYLISPSTLLYIGLLSFLNHKTEGKWTLDAVEIQLIRKQLDIARNGQSYHDVLPSIPVSFDCGHHLAQVLSELISALPPDMELDSNPGFASPVLLRIEAALGRAVCSAGCALVVPLLTQHFKSTDSMRLKQLCLRGIKYSLDNSTDQMDVALDSLEKTYLLTQVTQIATSTHSDLAMVPYSLEFLWMAGRELLYQTEKGVPETRRSVARSLLSTFDNPFKISSTGDGVPENRDEMGLANWWLPRINDICHSDPQSVLDSELLPHMIGFYEYKEHAEIKPRTTELPGVFDSTWTWLQILRHLEKSCKEAVEKRSKGSAPFDVKTALIPAICGVESREGESRLCLDMHDWSI